MRPLLFSLIFVAVIAGIAVAAHPLRPWLDSPACPACANGQCPAANAPPLKAIPPIAAPQACAPAACLPAASACAPAACSAAEHPRAPGPVRRFFARLRARRHG